MDWSVWVNCGLLVAFFVWLFWRNSEKPPTTLVLDGDRGMFSGMERTYRSLPYRAECLIWDCEFRVASNIEGTAHEMLKHHQDLEHPFRKTDRI